MHGSSLSIPIVILVSNRVACRVSLDLVADVLFGLLSAHLGLHEKYIIYISIILAVLESNIPV